MGGSGYISCWLAYREGTGIFSVSSGLIMSVFSVLVIIVG
jgi:hypothetical protein